jgi:hypothetical protein
MAYIKGLVLAGSPLVVMEMTGNRHDTMEFRIDESMKVSSMIGIFVEGNIASKRLSGVPTHGGAPFEFSPGWFSWDRDVGFVSPGRFQYEVVSETAKYYCLSWLRRAPLVLRKLVLGPGESVDVRAGNRLFVASGEGRVNGNLKSAPRLLTAASGDFVFTAETEVLAADIEPRVDEQP